LKSSCPCGASNSPGGTPDSPVRPATVDCLLTSGAADCGRSPAVDHWRSRPLLRGLTGQSGGTPDSLVIFSGLASRKPLSDQFAECSSLSSAHRTVECGSAPLAAASLIMLQTCRIVAQSFSLYVYMIFMLL
jgi:hypothetical protein